MTNYPQGRLATPLSNPQSSADTPFRPETFRLPTKGGDPFFGLTRSYYYHGEKLGYWRLFRLRKRGNIRGVTLVPFDEIKAFLQKQRPGTGQPATVANLTGDLRLSDHWEFSFTTPTTRGKPSEPKASAHGANRANLE